MGRRDVHPIQGSITSGSPLVTTGLEHTGQIPSLVGVEVDRPLAHRAQPSHRHGLAGGKRSGRTPRQRAPCLPLSIVSTRTSSIPSSPGARAAMWPTPVSRSEWAWATTIVVESHSKVPSDSGASVGIVKAATSRPSMGPEEPACSSPSGKELFELALESLLDYAPAVRIALAERDHKMLGLLEGDVRGKWRDLGIGDCPPARRDDRRATPRPTTCRSDRVYRRRRRVTRTSRRTARSPVGNDLRGLELRISGQRALLPRDLVEVAVVKH